MCVKYGIIEQICADSAGSVARIMDYYAEVLGSNNGTDLNFFP